MSMLSGRQLLLLRQMKSVNREEMAQNLKISVNEMTAYEYQLKSVPSELYQRWLALLK